MADLPLVIATLGFSWLWAVYYFDSFKNAALFLSAAMICKIIASGIDWFRR